MQDIPFNKGLIRVQNNGRKCFCQVMDRKREEAIFVLLTHCSLIMHVYIGELVRH